MAGLTGDELAKFGLAGKLRIASHRLDGTVLRRTSNGKTPLGS
jgi:hypothetical protein